MIRAWCVEHHVRTAADDAVCERDAARALRYADGSALRRHLMEGKPMPRYRTLNGRRWYRIEDLAAFLEGGFRD